jgi:thiamine biosynthesis lipoprotein
MSIGTAQLGRLELPALGSSALLLLTKPDRLPAAAAVLRAELTSIDLACSRFRQDSEISWLHENAGRGVTVSPVLAEALDAALRAAELTDGLVDPTVGAAVSALGYDRDFAAVPAQGSPADRTPPRPAPGWWRLSWNPSRREVVLPRGIELDLGATAKALAADRAAARAAAATDCGVLVDLGGDLRSAGTTPDGGWLVALADDHRNALADPDQTIALDTGGLATSSTAVRSWRLADSAHHHIVDPRTGQNPAPVWRTVTVAADSCLDANTASIAAIVLGADAPDWLAERGLPARLVALDGRVTRTPGWPANEEGG